MFPTADAEELSQVTSLLRPSEPTSDAHNSSGNTQVSSQQNSRELTLNMLLKEIAFCIALALTTYGALHNTSSKVSTHPQAVRFFNENSVVTDWFRGQLSLALSSVKAADVSFVMYYAPWDAESQYVRGEFEKAALVLGDYVHFSAINCWEPGSECRQQHYKIPSWPILMAYTLTSTGVHYKGPKDAHSMVKFLELIMRPLKRVTSEEELIDLISYCDAVAVGFTPLSRSSKYYNIWYDVSLKVREYDVIGEICFASVTSEELASELGPNTVPNARIILWNDTKDFITDEGVRNTWNESSLVAWVLENFSQPVVRIIPLWKKAFSFERYVDGSPILIMFTPLNPIYEQLPNYALMREVAMEYYNCRNNESNSWTTELIKVQQLQRLIYQRKDHMKYCQEFKHKKPTVKQNCYKKVESNSVYPWSNSTQKVPKNGVWSNFFAKRGLGVSRDTESEHPDFLSSDWLQECSTKNFPAEKSFYSNHEQCRLLEQNVNLVPQDVELNNDDIETTMLPQEDDPLSPENLIHDSVKHFCRLMKFAQDFSPPIFPSKGDEETRRFWDVNELSCSNNISLYMIAIDSVHNHHFAESLGIDVLSKKDMTAVVILDSKHESQYLLSEEFSGRSLRDFISNFTNKSLKRTLRTHIDDSAHTHYFGSKDTRQTERKDDGVEIMDLTTRSFRRILRTPGPLTIVSICGGPCGALTTRAVASAARLLTACGVPTRAARLDALRHDLSWQYTADTYPTVFVFPPHRGGNAESAMFPRSRRITTGGVVALAMRTLGAPAHLRARLALAVYTQSNTEKKTCLRDISEHVTTLIDRNLKYWRRTENRELKDALFKRLQHLHQVALELSLLHVSDLIENNIKQQSSLLESLTRLSNNWDVDVSLLTRKKTLDFKKS